MKGESGNRGLRSSRLVGTTEGGIGLLGKEETIVLLLHWRERGGPSEGLQKSHQGNDNGTRKY